MPDDRTTNPAIVLLVEDDRDQRDLYEMFFAARGFLVVATGSGDAVVEMARTTRPSVIVLDVRLPGVDGIEATKRLKADGDTEAIPIVVVSASVYAHHEEAAKTAGASAFVRKPVTPTDLLATIRGVIDGGA